MLPFACLILGLIAGLLITRQPGRLLLARWQALPLLFLALFAGLLQVLLTRWAQDWLWLSGRLPLTLLIAVRYSLGFAFITCNLLRRRCLAVSRVVGGKKLPLEQTAGLEWPVRLALLLTALGLVAEAAVWLANRGAMPIPEKSLQLIADPVLVVGIRNGALLTRQLIGPQTHLDWLGQIWHWPWLAQIGLRVFPFVSPAEVLTAAGLALTGSTLFFSPADPSRHPRKNNKEDSKPMARKPWFRRPDGAYLKDIDPFMRFFPYVMKGRNESAIYFRQQIDVTALKAYLGEKNRAAAASGSGFKSTLFHAVLAALVKVIVERPQVNRFVIGRRIYQRDVISFAFVIKSEFRDGANEEIAVMRFSPDDTLLSISEKLQKEIRKVREAAKASQVKRHGAVDWLNAFMKIPRLLLRAFVRFLGFLDYHGWLPAFVIDADPMHTSIFVTNLGSLFVDAPFHHLYEWGTTSAFLTIGVTSKAPVVQPDGSLAVRDVMNLGLTMDERVSDGYYFSKTIKRFQYFLEHPQELEKPSVPGVV